MYWASTNNSNRIHSLRIFNYTGRLLLCNRDSMWDYFGSVFLANSVFTHHMILWRIDFGSLFQYIPVMWGVVDVVVGGLLTNLGLSGGRGLRVIRLYREQMRRGFASNLVTPRAARRRRRRLRCQASLSLRNLDYVTLEYRKRSRFYCVTINIYW